MLSRPTAVGVECGAELLLGSVRSKGKHPGGAINAQLLEEIFAIRLHRLDFRHHQFKGFVYGEFRDEQADVFLRY